MVCRVIVRLPTTAGATEAWQTTATSGQQGAPPQSAPVTARAAAQKHRLACTPVHSPTSRGHRRNSSQSCSWEVKAEEAKSAWLLHEEFWLGGRRAGCRAGLHPALQRLFAGGSSLTRTPFLPSTSSSNCSAAGKGQQSGGQRELVGRARRLAQATSAVGAGWRATSALRARSMHAGCGACELARPVLHQ